MKRNGILTIRRMKECEINRLTGKESCREVNPKKVMTLQQAETAKQRAERFALNVLRDEDLADDIADESLEDWIERKGITIKNPQKENKPMATRQPSKADLENKIAELEEELSEYKEREEQMCELLGLEPEDEEIEDEDFEEEDEAA